MTNEQKAKELANYIEFGNWGTLNPDAYSAAIKMAEWKDEQLKNLITRLDEQLIQITHPTNADIAKRTILHDIWKELFETNAPERL